MNPLTQAILVFSGALALIGTVAATRQTYRRRRYRRRMRDALRRTIDRIAAERRQGVRNV